MKRKSPYNSPSQKSARGVNFFQQFSRQFLRPYGEADVAPSVETVLRRIQPFTCEWLLRPRVALSELSETILKNRHLITNESDGIFTEDFKAYLKDQLKPLEQSLKNLHKDCDRSATEDDVIETLKFLYQENESLDGLIDQLFQVGGAMFVLAIQYIVARTLIRCPEEFAEQVQAEDGTDSSFQSKKDIKSMRDFIVKSVIAKSRSSPLISPRRNLISEFDEPSSTKLSKFSSSKKRSTDEFGVHEDTGPSTSYGQRKSPPFSITPKKYQSGKITDSSDSSSSEEEEIAPPRQPLVPQIPISQRENVQQDQPTDVLMIKEEGQSEKEQPPPQKTKRAKKSKSPLEVIAEDEPISEAPVPTPEKKNKKNKKGKK